MSVGEPRSTAIRLGSYEILHQFAKGGMAELFLARAVGPEGFQKLVVLKKILPTFAANPRFVRLFLDEAKLAASLDHPNIAHVHDLGMVDGNYFFTMEHVHGKDVRSLLHRSLNAKVALPIEHVVHIARSVAAALHYAHERRGPDGRLLGIVHRDVSPSNVIVSFEGTVKLLDFGVAKAASSTVKTRTGALKGKVAYMSPEQAKGAAVDRRSDVFSTGIVLWEMTTARRLYKRDNDLATIQMIINEPPPRPSIHRPDAPAELDRIILRALAVDPEVRYQTAEDLQADLEELAREHKLNQSTIALSRHMGTLFAHEIDLWKRAEASGQQLSDHLIAVSEIRAEQRATPASDMVLDAFSEHGDDDDDDDSDSLSEAEPSSPSAVEADAERTERSEVPVKPLATSDRVPTVPAKPIRYSRPGLEPANWGSEPSIVLEDSISEAPGGAPAAPVVAAEVPSAAPQYVIAPEPTEHVARLPPPVAAAPLSSDLSIKPARRTGLWIGFVAASIVAIAVGVVMRKGSSDAPSSEAQPTAAAPAGADPIEVAAPASDTPATAATGETAATTATTTTSSTTAATATNASTTKATTTTPSTTATTPTKPTTSPTTTAATAKTAPSNTTTAATAKTAPSNTTTPTAATAKTAPSNITTPTTAATAKTAPSNITTTNTATAKTAPSTTATATPTKIPPAKVATPATTAAPTKVTASTKSATATTKPKAKPAPRKKPSTPDKPPAKFDPNAALPPM